MKLRSVVLFFVLFALSAVFIIGCDRILNAVLGDEKDGDGASTPAADTAKSDGEEKKGEETANAEEDTTPKKNPLLEGIPELDLEIGPSLADVPREESQELNKKATKLYRKNDFDGALEYYIKALEKNPSNLQFRYNIAATYTLKGDAERAIALLDQMKNAEDCARCFIMLAKATEDEDFDKIKSDERFVALTKGAPERLTAELKSADWLKFDPAGRAVPVATKGLPAISDDGKRVIVTSQTANGYRMQLILVSSGKVINSAMLLNKRELEEYQNDELSMYSFKAIVQKRIDKAHRVLLGRTWLPFKMKSKTIAPTWLNGKTEQQFNLGNSIVDYDYPKIKITNSKGRAVFKGKIGEFPADDCTDVVAIKEAYVHGETHTMLFKIGNHSMRSDCDTEPGKWYVLKLE